MVKFDPCPHVLALLKMDRPVEFVPRFVKLEVEANNLMSYHGAVHLGRRLKTKEKRNI